MTVAALAVRAAYVETGDPATLYAIPFQYLSSDQVVVARFVDGEEVAAPGYSVTGDGGASPPTGKVQLGASTAGATLEIRRVTPLTQGTVYTDREDFPTASHGDSMDRLVMAQQEQAADLTRALLVPRGEAAGTLPAHEGGKFVGTKVGGGFYYASGTGADEGLRVDLADPEAGASLIALAAGLSVATAIEAIRINVKGFGATGDGATDDTEAINAAIERIEELGGYGYELFFPAGEDRNYVVSVQDGNEQTLRPIPLGASVFMATGAWIKPSTADAVTSVFMPLGDNRLRVFVDGGSLSPEHDVDTGVTEENPNGMWVNASQGIRAYSAVAGYGRGARNVLVYDSEFRNLRYGIQTEGAFGWRVINSTFERIKFTGVLHGCSNSYDSVYNIVSGCRFKELGDTAVAFYETGGNTTGELAYCLIANNLAEETNLIAAGCAYDVEQGSALLQRHIAIVGNLARNIRTDVNALRGGIIANTLTDGLIASNTLHGALGSNADVGVIALRGVRVFVIGNQMDGYRAGGINLDGGTGCAANDNMIANCGGALGNSHAITMAAVYDCINGVACGNIIANDADYPYHTAGSAAISAAAASGKIIQGLTIRGNTITLPLHYGIQVIGRTGALATGVSILDNVLNGAASGAFFAGHAIQTRYCDTPVVGGLPVLNAVAGFDMRDCTSAILRDAMLRGSRTIAQLDDFTGSTGTRVENRRVFQTVTDAIVTGGAGTGTVWECSIVKTSASGLASGTTDASGDLTVTPGMTSVHSVSPTSFTPTLVTASAKGTSFAHVQVHSEGANTFKLRFLDAAGAALASTAVAAYWRAAA